MPGRLFLTRPIFDVEVPPRNNIQPGQEVMVWTGDTLRAMRWGIVPVGRVNARGRPVMENIINARSETVFAKSAFAGTSRAIVPCDGWYEWTGKARKKQAWRIQRADGGLLYFAAITDVWTAPGGREVPQVAMVTCEPSDDVARIHHRMGVILEPWGFDAWLTGTIGDAKTLCQPAPKGMLVVRKADDVDWTAA